MFTFLDLQQDDTAPSQPVNSQSTVNQYISWLIDLCIISKQL